IQQQKRRGGTENSLGIALTGLATQLLEENQIFPTHLSKWHRDFENELKHRMSGVVIHGEKAPRLPNTTFVGFEGLDKDGVLVHLDLNGIHASSGSACNSGNHVPSHVLLAMGCTPELARSSIRFSSGHSSTWADFEQVLGVLPKIIERMRVPKLWQNVF